MRMNSDRGSFKNKITEESSSSRIDIKYNDKVLKRARQESMRIKNQTPDQPSEGYIESQREQLLEFEKRMNNQKPIHVSEVDSSQLV